MESHASGPVRGPTVASLLPPCSSLVTSITLAKGQEMSHVALVKHKDKPETALLFVSADEHMLYVHYAWPVVGTLEIKVRGTGNVEVLVSERQLGSVCLDVHDASNRDTFCGSVSECIERAKREDFTFDSYLLKAHHVWLDMYSEAAAAASDAADASNLLVKYSIADRTGTYDPTRLTDIKEFWVHNQLTKRASEFTDTLELSILLGTWNVNGQLPTNVPLEQWFDPPGGAAAPDIVAIGFQELDLSAGALLVGNDSRVAPWEKAISTALQSFGPYELIMTKQLVGILLLVFVRTEHRQHITAVETQVAATGIMGVMGNKGGTVVHFHAYDSSICIINCHLNAHHDNFERRNQDHRDIVHKIRFSDGRGIHDHDYVFWMGDLNYRINQSDSAVRAAVLAKDWDSLLQDDQLNLARQQELAFQRFEEPPIDFAPTYKYNIGTDIYDTSEKRRTPAWCDRVLHCVGGAKTSTVTTTPSSEARQRGQSQSPSPSLSPAGNASPLAPTLRLIHYGRVELLSSDHRPVRAMHMMRVNCVRSDTRKRVYHDIVKQLDKMENECMPDAALSQSQIDFGPITYDTPVTRSLVVENIGQVILKFSFIPKLAETNVCKPWMHIEPPGALVMPGDRHEVNLTIHVDQETAQDLNTGASQLEDILVIHLENGKDYFVFLTAQYMTSCFGCSLDYLCRFPLPVRHQTEPLSPDSEEALSIPKELWQMVDYVFQHGMDEEGIFLHSGVPSEMATLREMLDIGAPLEKYLGSIHSVAECLIRFLDSLSNPVIPVVYHRQCIEAHHDATYCHQIVRSLPPVNYNVFHYLVSFMRELLHPKYDNGLSADNIATVFSSALLRPSASKSKRMGTSMVEKEKQFLLRFLELQDR